jgi:prepilin peptidase CpaA
MGGGDLKLLAALGTMVGPRDTLIILMATAIAGGLMAVIYAIYRGRLWSTLLNTATVMKFHASSGLQAHPEANLDNPEALRLPYGLAIAAGTFYTFVTEWWR